MSQQTPQNRVLFRRGLAPAMAAVFVALSLLSTLAVLFSVTATASAATNSTLNFQARLENSAGNIAPDGYYNVEFKLYNVSSAGSALWTETYYDSNGATAGNDNRIEVRNGYVTANLGSLTAFPTTISWDQDMWVTMNIGGTAQTATPTWDGEMNPRLKLTGVPYAFKAGQLATFNASTGFTSTLSILQPTVGNQTFQIADQGAAGTYDICIANSSSCGFALSNGSSGNYIQNQNASQQAGANFWIGGTGRADSALQAPTIDTPTGVALNIGTTNATAINLNQNVTIASGKTFTANGNALFQANVASATTFQITGATGNPLFNVDSTTLNRVTNSSFETDTSNWSNKGAGTVSITQTSAQSHHGFDSLSASVTAATAGVQTSSFTAAITTNTQYEVTFMARCSASITTFTYGRQDVSGTDINASTTATCNTNWQRYTFHYTTGATVTSPNIYMTLGTSTGTLFVDAVQMLQTTTNGAQAYAAGNIKIGGVITDAVVIRNAANSTNAFEVQNATGTGNNFVVDTVNNRININTTGYGANLNIGGTSIFRTTTNSATGYQIQNSAGMAILNVDTATASNGNLLANPGIEANTTGWTTYTGGTLSRQTTIANTYSGVAYAQVATTAANHGIRTNGTAGWLSGANPGAGTYTLSFYAKASVAMTGTLSFGYNAGSDTDCSTGNTVTTTNMTRFSCTFTAGATVTYVYMKQTDATARNIYIDGIQLVSGSTIKPYSENGAILLNGLVNTPALFQNVSDSTTAFQIQNSAGTSNLFIADTLNNQITIGGTLNVSGTTTVTTLNATTGIQTGGTTRIDASGNLTNIGTISASGNLTTTANVQGVTLIGTTSVQAPLIDTSTASALNIGTTNATQVNLNKNVTVAAGQYISLVGGITSTRPASPTEGMLYYDTTTKQLLVYANAKWQADRSSSTIIVGTGATDVTSGAIASKAPDGADFVNTSTTNAQTTIQAAISALPSTGGTVYIMEGTYIIDTSISLPSNITLMGAGDSTIIKFKNGINVTFSGIVNSDTVNGNIRITVKNLRIDGNKTNQTAGGMTGIYFTKVGAGAGLTSNATPGALIQNIWVNDMYGTTGGGIILDNSDNITVANSHVWNNANHGLLLDDVDGFTVTGNRVQQNGNHGIYSFTSSSAGTISDNMIEGNVNNGIYLQSNNYVTVSGNSIVGNGAAGIRVANNSADNIVTGNAIHNNTSDGIFLANNAARTSITSNKITDTAGTTNAINISASTVNDTYLADNTYSGTGATSINDSGTGTVYANQLDQNGYLMNRSAGALFQTTSNSATAFRVQNAANANMLTVNTTNAAVMIGEAAAGTAATAALYFGDNCSNFVQTCIKIGEYGGTDSDNLQLHGAAGLTFTTGYATQTITGVLTNTGRLGIGIGNNAPTAALHVTGVTGGVDLVRINDGTATTADVLTIADEGATIFRNRTDSTTAFRIQNAAGNSYFTADSGNQRITTKDLVVGTPANVGIASRLFSDGFETGDLTGWTGLGGSGTLGFSTATVRGGKYAASLTTAATGAYAEATISPNTTVYGRAYFNVASLGDPTVLMDFGTGKVTTGNHLYIYLGATGYLCYNSTLNTLVSACSTTAPTTSAWHKLETTITISGTVGVLQVWLDGTLVTTNANAINLSAQNFGTTPLSNFALGNSTSSTATVYFDDVAVDTVTTGDSSSLYVADTLHVSGSSSFEGILAAGTTATGYGADVQNGINAGAGYYAAGQEGLSSGCTNGQGLRDIRVSGGIIVGGSCGNAASTLQDAYDNTEQSSGGSTATPTLVRQATGSSTNSTTVSTTLTATASGNLLVATIGTARATTASVVTGVSGGGTWYLAAVGPGGATNTHVEVWYCWNCGSATTVTATVDLTPDALTINVSEYSGIQSSSDPLEVAAGGTGSTPKSTTQVSPTVNTTNSNELIYVALSFKNSAVTSVSTPTPGYTALTSVELTAKKSYAAYKVGASTGAYNATWTLTGSDAAGGVVTVAFKPAVTGGSTVASILLADAKDYIITAPDTATDSNIIVNMQCRTGCSTSQGRWAVQSNGTDALSMLYDPGAAVTDVRIQTGVNLKLASGGVGLAKGVITHDWTCTSTEQVYDIVVTTTDGAVERATVAASTTVVGVVVSKPSATVCSVATQGLAQVWFGSNAITRGNGVQTSTTAGAAKNDINSPNPQTTIGKTVSTKDASNLAWVLLR